LRRIESLAQVGSHSEHVVKDKARTNQELAVVIAK